MARVVGTRLSARSGQPVIVDPRPGGGGAIAVQAVLKAEADGHTLLFTGSSVLAEIHVVSVPYNTLTDLRPVASLGRTHLLLVQHPSLPGGSLKELIAHAKRSRAS